MARVVLQTIHGWPVILDGKSPLLKQFKIAGTKRSLLLRSDVGAYLAAFAADYHRLIAPIDEGTFDDWAWSPYRKGRASEKISDHCAGVAMDLNATKEGSQSKSNVFWATHPKKAKAMKALLAKYNLLEWGGNYTRFYDPMHVTFKYGVTSAQIKAAIKGLGKV